MLIEQAARRGRAWVRAFLSGNPGVTAWLRSDDVEGCDRMLGEATRAFGSAGRPPTWPDYGLLIGRAMVDVYAGEPARGFARLEAQRHAYARARLTKGRGLRSLHYVIHRGGCATSALASQRPGTSYQRAVWREAARHSAALLRGAGSAALLGMAEQFDAAVALADAQHERALGHLRAAVKLLDCGGAAANAAAARRRLGQLSRGTEGASLLVAGDAWLSAQGIRNLDAMTELLCPGCRV